MTDVYKRQDAKKKGDSWTVVVNGGRIDMNIDAIEWAKKAEELGAGEIPVSYTHLNYKYKRIQQEKAY